MGALAAVYRRLPPSAGHVAVSMYGLYWRWLRFGGNFAAAAADFASRENATAEQWSAYQTARLGEVLSAAGRTPYYRDAWSASQRRAAAEGRLAEIPILEKEPLRQDPRRFLDESGRDRKLLSFHTSGSTGTPLLCLTTVEELRRTMAIREVRSARWAGVSFRDRRATFSGRLVEPDPESSGPYYRWNAAEGQVYFSAFHLKPSTAADYVRALRRHRVRWITGYAVSAYLLARYAREQGLEVPRLAAIVTTSEKVTPEMRRTMEEAYGCRVFEEYSNVENSCFASECREGRLHVSPDGGLIEILRPDGSPSRPGEAGEVVTTSFLRTAQPLIRYRLGDLAVWSDRPCPCGRAMPVIEEIVGRLEDVVTAPDGRQLVRFHGIFIDQPHVREGQVVQETLERFLVRIHPAPGFDEADRAEVVRRMHERLGPRVAIEVELVDGIPRTQAGKFRAVISRLPRPSGGAEPVA